MANVALLGAVYADVPAVQVPAEGGGVATFYEVNGSQTITQNGTYDVSAFAEAVVNVSGGGGGASNIVTGTFKGTVTGSDMDIDLPYTGTGYPIVAVVFPVEGPYNSEEGSWYNLIQKFAISSVLLVKSRQTTVPTYDGRIIDNAAMVATVYKSSGSGATSYSRTSSNSVFVLMGEAATNTATASVSFKDDTKMSVFIASTSYGFAANIEYRYYVIYSE